MNKVALLLSLLVAVPAAAQSFSAAVSYGQLQSQAQAYAATPNGVGAQTFQEFGAETLGAFGAQLSWAAVSFGPLAIELTAAYQVPATKNLTSTTWVALNGVPATFGATATSAQLRESYAAVGARLAGHLLIDWGVGVEARSESLRLVSDPGTLSTTLTRPWVEGAVGFTIPSPVIKPFVAVTWALALSKVTNDGGYDTKLVQSMAPKSELALQVGIRF
jgi:hypothetical protein